MKVYRIAHKQILTLTETECWNFFSDPNNLQKITPPNMDFQIKSDLPASIYPGQIIIYRVKLLPGVKINWVTEITHVDKGNYFVDEQRFGPYTFWQHQHIFKEAESGMEVHDIVHYAVPLGILGRLANSLFVRTRLNKIFQYRKNYLGTYFK